MKVMKETSFFKEIQIEILRDKVCNLYSNDSEKNSLFLYVSIFLLLCTSVFSSIISLFLIY